MTTTETLKLALEALEEINKLSIGANAVCLPAEIDTAMDALREALASEAIEQKSGIKQVIELYDSPDQPAQQEPVVWMYVNKSTHETKFQKHMRDFVDHSLWSEVPLYGEPLANHELQCVCGAVWLGDELVHLPDKRPPAQRTWAGLTDEEVMVAAYQAGFDIHEDYENEDDPEAMHWWTPDGEACDDSLLKLRDLIEAKLKEKNCG